MRIAIEALTSEELDFRASFGNFRFRWDARLRDCGLKPVWQVDLPDTVLAIAPHDALQILHIVQEALTNVVKHARASTVTVRLRHDSGTLALDVLDHGVGAAAAKPAASGGRGQSNMARRAQRLAGTVETDFGACGARVSLRMPLASEPLGNTDNGERPRAIP
jgi:signal transduction histidine kinase